MPTSSEPCMTIGEVAAQLGVAASALRYWERLGLVEADERVSGRRRFRSSTVRRLVFVQMLQDAGLSLDEIRGVLDAPNRSAWQSIATERLERLDAEIDKLTRARELLAAALLCRFDHPLDECDHMNHEIDHRLGHG